MTQRQTVSESDSGTTSLSSLVSDFWVRLKSRFEFNHKTISSNVARLNSEHAQRNPQDLERYNKLIVMIHKCIERITDFQKELSNVRAEEVRAEEAVKKLVNDFFVSESVPIFYWTMFFMGEEAVLTELVKRVPELFMELSMEIWLKSPDKGFYAGRSALYRLSENKDGRATLALLVNRVPKLSDPLTIETWFEKSSEIEMERGIGPFFYNLTQDETGEKILTRWASNPEFLKSFNRFPEGFMKFWRLSLESGASDSLKALNWLSRTKFGQRILAQLASHITYPAPASESDTSGLAFINQRLETDTNWIVEHTRQAVSLSLPSAVANIIIGSVFDHDYYDHDYYDKYQACFMAELTMLRARCFSDGDNDEKADSRAVERLNGLVKNPVAQIYFRKRPLLAASVLSQQWSVLSLENKSRLLSMCPEPKLNNLDLEVFFHRHLFKLLTEFEGAQPREQEVLARYRSVSSGLLIDLLSRCFSVVKKKVSKEVNQENELLSLLSFKRMVVLLRRDACVRQWFKDTLNRAGTSLPTFRFKQKAISTLSDVVSLLESDDLSYEDFLSTLTKDFLAKLPPAAEDTEETFTVDDVKTQYAHESSKAEILRTVGLICWRDLEKVSVPDFSGDFLLNYPVEYEHKIITQLLLGLGVNMKVDHDKDNQALLGKSVDWLDARLLSLLLLLGVKSDVKDERKWTPLHYVALPHKNFTPVFNLLLEAGASVNMKDSEMTTPLHLAVSPGPSLKVWLFLKHGADVNAQDKDDRSPLYEAARWTDNDSTIRLLFSAGADMRGIIDGKTEPEIIQRIRNNILPGSILLGGNIRFSEADLERARVDLMDLPQHYQPLYNELLTEVAEDKSTDYFVSRLVYAIGGFLQKMDHMTAFQVGRYLTNLRDHLQSDKLLLESLNGSDLKDGKEILSRLSDFVKKRHGVRVEKEAEKPVTAFFAASGNRVASGNPDALSETPGDSTVPEGGSPTMSH